MASRHVVIAAVAALLTTVPVDDAHAQPAVAAGTWLISAAAALGFDEDADAEQDVALGASIAVGAAVSAHLAIEAEAAHLFDLAVNDPASDPSLTTVHGSLLYLFRQAEAAAPYVAAGAGVGYYPPGHTASGFNVGAGIILTHGADVWFRTDIRYFAHAAPVPAAWRLAVALMFWHH